LDVDLFGFQVYPDIKLDILTECTTRPTAMGLNDCPLEQLSIPNTVYPFTAMPCFDRIAPRKGIMLALFHVDDPSRVNSIHIVSYEQAVLPKNSTFVHDLA
jgi:hypothetical protein